MCMNDKFEICPGSQHSSLGNALADHDRYGSRPSYKVKNTSRWFSFLNEVSIEA